MANSLGFRLVGFLLLLGACSPALAQECAGDCDGNNAVTVDEIVRGVGIALDLNPLAGCTALDTNRDAQVDIAEIVVAVGNLVAGCPAPDPRIVRTEGGLLRGTSANGVRSFLGVPYAAPPTGQLRWRAPQPHPGWSGTRLATQAGSSCPQRIPIINSEVGAEDCLFLNVHAPVSAPAQPLPVMVWIHGGGFTSGDGLQFGGTDGSDMVRRGGVLVVSLNYRVGALGFLAHRALSQENSSGASVSGNYGFLDQIAALQWVRRNIGAFGGDPNNVTIFGESAGGFSVCYHLVSPLSAGLFHKAISQSGVCTPTTPTLGAGEAQGDRFATALGCDTPFLAADCLRAKTVDAVRRTLPPDPNFAFTEGEWGEWSPIIDGHVLTQQVPTAFAAGAFHHVPVLFGSTKDEGTLFVALSHDVAGMPLTAESYPERLAYFLGRPELVAAATAQYPLSAYANPGAALAAAFGDAYLGCGPIEAARQLAAFVPTYLYQFNYPDAPFAVPLPVMLGAYHSAEIQFVFGRRTGTPFTTAERQLSDQVLGYWTRFAATGNPNGGGAPEWPPHGAAANYLAIDRQSTSGQMPKQANCAFWRGLDYFQSPLEDPWLTARQALDANRAKWAAAGIDSYSINYNRSCFCVPPSLAEVVVRNNEVIAVRDPQTGAPIDAGSGAWGFNSIAATFEVIDNAIAQRVAELVVQYDPLLGYPTHVSIDHDLILADDEIGIRIDNFAQLR